MRVHRELLNIATKGEFHVVDITSDVEKALLNSGVDEGYALVFSRHTTCGVVVNEKETGLLEDVYRMLCRLVPEAGYYQHNDWSMRTENMHPEEPPNAHAHLRQLIAGKNSEYVPVSEACLLLGQWQRIMVIELDCAREREILIQVCGV